MNAILRRYPATSYFVLAFAISWGGVLAAIGGGDIPATPDVAHARFALVYLAMLVGPPVAGITLTLATGRRIALRDYGARLVKWRVAPVWYAVALLTAPIVTVAALLLLAPLAGATMTFVPGMVAAGEACAAGPIATGSRLSFVLIGLAVGAGAGVFEELVWTGFAVPTLRTRFSPMRTGVIVGLLWGAWHALAVYWGSASSFGSVPVGLFMLVALFSFLPPYRVLMVRVYERTHSTLVGIVMHASLTATMLLVGPDVAGTASVLYNVVFASLLWVAVALLALAGRRSTRPLGVMAGAT